MPEPAVNQPTSQNNPANPSSADNFVVHTMPQKFLSLRPQPFSPSSKAHKKQRSLKNNLIIGAIIIIVLGSLMLLAAWLFVKSIKQSDNSQPTAQAPAAKKNNLNSDSPAPAAQPKTATSSAPVQPTVDYQQLLSVDQWQSVENKQYYYSLKAPASWQKKTVASEDQPTGSNRLEQLEFTDEHGKLFFKLDIFDNTQQLSLADWLFKTRRLSSAQLQPFTLHNQPAYKLIDEQQGQYVIYALYGNYIYALTFKQAQDDNFKQVNNHLLVNFKFTPLSPSSGQQKNSVPNNFQPAIDSDHDGLTDEEEVLYGTDKNKRDTDADGYTDGDEVANLYNPLKPGHAKIYDSRLVVTYVNNRYHYNLIYPAVWQIKDDGDSVIFQDKNGEFIQVLVVKDEQNYNTVLDWYKANVDQDVGQLTKFEIDGVQAIRTLDGYKVYFLYNGYLYSLIYNIGLRQDANFMVTFDMIVKSLNLMPVD